MNVNFGCYWENSSIIGQFVEHNRLNFWAMPKSIIGKKKSIICLALVTGGALAVVTGGALAVVTGGALVVVTGGALTGSLLEH